MRCRLIVMGWLGLCVTLGLLLGCQSPTDASCPTFQTFGASSPPGDSWVGYLHPYTVSFGVQTSSPCVAQSAVLYFWDTIYGQWRYYQGYAFSEMGTFGYISFSVENLYTNDWYWWDGMMYAGPDNISASQGWAPMQGWFQS